MLYFFDAAADRGVVLVGPVPTGAWAAAAPVWPAAVDDGGVA